MFFIQQAPLYLFYRKPTLHLIALRTPEAVSVCCQFRISQSFEILSSLSEGTFLDRKSILLFSLYFSTIPHSLEVINLFFELKISCKYTNMHTREIVQAPLCSCKYEISQCSFLFTLSQWMRPDNLSYDTPSSPLSWTTGTGRCTTLLAGCGSAGEAKGARRRDFLEEHFSTAQESWSKTMK